MSGTAPDVHDDESEDCFGDTVSPPVVDDLSLDSVCSAGSPIAGDEFARQAAETLCSLYVNCGCTESDGDFADLDSCVTELEAKFAEDRTAAEAAGMTFSAEAAGGLIESWQQAGCKLTDLADTADCCPIYNGSVEGETRCNALIFGSDCAAGSNCTDYRAIPCPSGDYGPYGACGEGGSYPVCGGCLAPVGLGERCSTRFQCWDSELDLWCNPDTGVCEALDLPLRGEPCTPGRRCGDETHCPRWEGPTLACSIEPVCADYPAPGEPCERVREINSSDYHYWGACEDGSECQNVDGAAVCVSMAPRRAADRAPCETSEDCIHTCIDGECMTVRLCYLQYFW